MLMDWSTAALTFIMSSDLPLARKLAFGCTMYFSGTDTVMFAAHAHEHIASVIIISLISRSIQIVLPLVHMCHAVLHRDAVRGAVCIRNRAEPVSGHHDPPVGHRRYLRRPVRLAGVRLDMFLAACRASPRVRDDETREAR